eukprot:m.353971 g.353971  ORF g.353971 m.353971 type:complete len:487 (-) comp16882_c0_seq1:337-1797(-)
MMNKCVALACLVAAFAAVVVVVVADDPAIGILTCQVQYGEALIGASDDPALQCDAYDQLARCLAQVANMTEQQQASSQAYLDAAQLTVNCTEDVSPTFDPPSITTSDHYLTIQVDKERDVKFFRKRSDETTSIWTLADEVERLSAGVATTDCMQVSTLEDAEASVLATFESKITEAEAEAAAQLSTIAASLHMLATTLSTAAEMRHSELMDTITSTQSTVESTMEAATASQMTRFDTTSTSVDSAIETGTARIDEATDDLSTGIANAYSAMDAAEESVFTRMSAVASTIGARATAIENEYSAAANTINGLLNAELAKAQGEVYTHWGQSVCPSGHTKLYQGIMYASHYTHHGAAGQICMPESPNNGATTGTSSLDLLYPCSIDHNHGTPLTSQRTIVCARCVAPSTSCMVYPGVTGCPSGYNMAYRGYMFGAHYGHSGPSGRVCINENLDTSIGNSDNYVYTTRIQSATTNIPSGNSVRCVQCCKN